VGGITPACGEVAAAWYEGAIQQIHTVSSAEAAEMAKLLENTFRMINIGLVNEMAVICERLGVDVWEVIDAAATKPFGFMKFTPAPGWVGTASHRPAVPVLKMKPILRALLGLASVINANMQYVVSRLLEA
jgi:UDP-N-acetyl-D-glucosamine dehydrogenase